MMDEKRDIGATDIDGTPSSFKNVSPTGAQTREPGIVDQQAAAEPEAIGRQEQRDNSNIAFSKTATASFDSGFAPIGATDGESVLAWGQKNSPPAACY